MVWTRGIPGGRADAAILLANHCGVVEPLVLRIAPVLAAHAHVQPFRARFGKPVGERLQHDRAVVVPLRLELGKLPFDSQSRGDRERARVIV